MEGEEAGRSAQEVARLQEHPQQLGNEQEQADLSRMKSASPRAPSPGWEGAGAGGSEQDEVSIF